MQHLRHLLALIIWWSSGLQTYYVNVFKPQACLRPALVSRINSLSLVGACLDKRCTSICGNHFQALSFRRFRWVATFKDCDLVLFVDYARRGLKSFDLVTCRYEDACILDPTQMYRRVSDMAPHSTSAKYFRKGTNPCLTSDQKAEWFFLLKLWWMISKLDCLWSSVLGI